MRLERAAIDLPLPSVVGDHGQIDSERVAARATPAWSVSSQPTSLCLLFLVSADNGLSQRALIELTERGHEVVVAVADSAAEMQAAVDLHRPQLIVCPFLKTLIPESIWSTYRCLIVHPGRWGDRPPSSLDWSIELGMRECVTVIEASGGAEAIDRIAGDTEAATATVKARTRSYHRARRPSVYNLGAAPASTPSAVAVPRAV